MDSRLLAKLERAAAVKRGGQEEQNAAANEAPPDDGDQYDASIDQRPTSGDAYDRNTATSEFSIRPAVPEYCG